MASKSTNIVLVVTIKCGIWNPLKKWQKMLLINKKVCQLKKQHRFATVSIAPRWHASRTRDIQWRNTRFLSFFFTIFIISLYIPCIGFLVILLCEFLPKNHVMTIVVMGLNIPLDGKRNWDIFLCSFTLLNFNFLHYILLFFRKNKRSTTSAK